MATLAEELTALKTEEDKITGNKVANFSYDDYAYTNNDANGVDTYNVDNHQNIPNGTASILKVNPTILTKGWRAQASAITRMLMNHFLGRCSYNLNKINDHFSTLLAKLIAYLGVANGIATLDANGYVPTGQLSPTGVVKTVNGASPVNGNITKAQIGINNVVNTGDSATPVSGGTTKFTTGGAYTELAKKAPNNHASSSTTYGVASSSNYGHVKARAFYGTPQKTLSPSEGTIYINHYGMEYYKFPSGTFSLGYADIWIENSLPVDVVVCAVSSYNSAVGSRYSDIEGMDLSPSAHRSTRFFDNSAVILLVTPKSNVNACLAEI